MRGIPAVQSREAAAAGLRHSRNPARGQCADAPPANSNPVGGANVPRAFRISASKLPFAESVWRDYPIQSLISSKEATFHANFARKNLTGNLPETMRQIRQQLLLSRNYALQFKYSLFLNRVVD